MSAEVTESAVLSALDRVVDPCSIATGVPISLPDMGLVQRIEIDQGAVSVTLQLTSPICLQAMNIFAAIEERVLELDGVETVTCTVDYEAQWLPSMMSEQSRAELRRRRDPSRLPPPQPRHEATTVGVAGKRRR